MIHREVADHLLEGSGKSLEELQLEIDRTVKPHSFVLEQNKIRFDLVMKEEGPGGPQCVWNH